MNEVARIVPTKPDAEIAADLKKRMVEAYQPVLDLCTEANAAGFEIGINSGMEPLGRHVITVLKVAKVY